MDRAALEIARAIEFDPQSPTGYLFRGYIARARKDYASMAQDLDRALQLAPPNWEYRAAIEKMKAETKR
jgi:hypothetical protein